MDGEGKFIDAVCGFPGSAHDARVLRNSELYYNAERGNILQAPVVTIGGRDIRENDYQYIHFDLRNRTYNIYLKQFHRGLVQKFGYMNHILKQFSVSVLL